MSEYLVYAEKVEANIRRLLDETNLRIEPSVHFVSCKCIPEHFIPLQALQKHLKKIHGIKHIPPISSSFFYSQASSIQKIELVPPTEMIEETKQRRNFQSQERLEDAYFEEETDLDESIEHKGICRSIMETNNESEEDLEWTAKVQLISKDPITFYLQVQKWKLIPRSFERLPIHLMDKKPLQGWMISYFSKTIFKDEPLDMDLIDFIIGLLDHKDYCQPDSLMNELEEFLGRDVVSFVLGLWKYLLIALSMEIVYKSSLDKIAQQAKAEAAFEAEKVLEQMKKQLKEAASVNTVKTPTERDYKRRRPCYRGKKTKKTHKEALRELIEVQMLDLSEQTGDKIAGIGVKQEDMKDSTFLSTEDDAWNWKKLIGINNPLLIRDMDRHPQPQHGSDKRRPDEFPDDQTHQRRRRRSRSRFRNDDRGRHRHHHRRSQSRSTDRKQDRHRDKRTRSRSHTRSKRHSRSRSPNQTKRHHDRHSRDTSRKRDRRRSRSSSSHRTLRHKSS